MTKAKNPIQETIDLIKSDEFTRAYFFSKAKASKWFEPLKANGFFEVSTIPLPAKTEKGYVMFGWPPQAYLDRISHQIECKWITDPKFIESFLGVLRKISVTNGNYLLGRGLFVTLLRMPLAKLNENDIKQAFSWLLEGTPTDTLVETAGREGFKQILSQSEDSNHARNIFKQFARQLFTTSPNEKYRGRDPKLTFFSDWGYKEFSSKHFNVTELAVTKKFILFDMIDVCENILETILSATDLDKSTQWWRPAIEEHHQNNYHDSAQAILVGIIGMSSLALAKQGEILPQLDKWKYSNFKTFNRLYLFIMSQATDNAARSEAASSILEWDFPYECVHEVYHFLRIQFEYLPDSIQNQILDYIENITSDYGDSDEMNKKQTAWRKLRLLEALANSSSVRAKELRDNALTITDGGVPENPDFVSYMSSAWVGPTSPVDEKWLTTASFAEILEKLLTFRSSTEFASPSVEGLARLLETWTIKEPMRASSFIKEFDKLNSQYVSAFIDGYSKCWAEKKYVPVKELIDSIKQFINYSDFSAQVASRDNEIVGVVTAMCRFIETGTRNDEHAFDPSLNEELYHILKKFLEVVRANDRYSDTSDAYSRAINEPRGRCFGALIILTLRRARLSQQGTSDFEHAWNDLEAIVSPILMSQDESEVSLHAHIGAHYRQFQFLSKDWVVQKIDLLVPPRAFKPSLWRAFLDGFSYVTFYSREIYSLLRRKGHLLEYLRLEPDASDRNSRLNRLQTRIIELALVAYVLGDETLNEGIIACIVKDKNVEEWREMISSISSIIGDEPQDDHLVKAKELILKLIEIRELEHSKVNFADHFKGLGRFLEQLRDPSDELVRKIIEIVASDKESPWELGDLIEYLHGFKDSHAGVVGQLYKLLLDVSKSAPAWPPDKIEEISRALIQNGQLTTMIDVCRIYSERSPTCEPLREICASLGKPKQESTQNAAGTP